MSAARPSASRGMIIGIEHDDPQQVELHIGGIMREDGERQQHDDQVEGQQERVQHPRYSVRKFSYTSFKFITASRPAAVRQLSIRREGIFPAARPSGKRAYAKPPGQNFAISVCGAGRREYPASRGTWPPCAGRCGSPCALRMSISVSSVSGWRLSSSSIHSCRMFLIS